MTLENIVIGLLLGAVGGWIANWLIHATRQRELERLSERWINEHERDSGKS